VKRSSVLLMIGRGGVQEGACNSVLKIDICLLMLYLRLPYRGTSIGPHVPVLNLAVCATYRLGTHCVACDFVRFLINYILVYSCNFTIGVEECHLLGCNALWLL
jgi:hypothetical protein